MKLSHWNKEGEIRMIDVSEKNFSQRIAKASGSIIIKKEVIEKIKKNETPKGDVFNVAKIAAITAAKQTSLLIPMCHPLNITHCNIEFELKEDRIIVFTTIKTYGKTGVEMEALTATSICLLTIYDMLKPIDKSMIITEIKLEEKQGGKSGHWIRKD